MCKIKKILISTTVFICIACIAAALISCDTEELPDLSKTAYLVIDIQNDYFPGGNYALQGSNDASENAAKILKYYRENKYPVIHIQHIATHTGATFFLPNTNGSEIHDNVKPLKAEKLFVKHDINSFSNTGLQEYLKKNEIKDLIIVGMQSNVCVQTASLHAKSNNYNVIVINDALAATTEKNHESTVKLFSEKEITLYTTKEFLLKAKFNNK